MVLLKNTCLGLLLLCLAATIAHAQSPTRPASSNNFAAIQKGFLQVPDTIQTSTYWYWLSGNVSKTGIVKDLEAMKKVGINRAFIGDIGLGDVQQGKVKFLSDEWWELLHTALKTATRLNIQIGIFNGPGWSQSGGPWVKPKQTMRYLSSSQVMVKGPILFNKALSSPDPDFQDVKVLAYPVPADYGTDINALKPKISSKEIIDSLGNLMDNNLATAIHFKQGQQFSLDVNTPNPYTVRSITINTTHQAVYLEGELQAQINNAYVPVKHFTIDRRSPGLNFGFLPWAESVISIPATKATAFRLVFTKVSANGGFTGLKLSSTAMTDSYMEKTLAKAWQTEDLIWNAYLWEPQADAPSKYVIAPGKVMDISKFMTTDGIAIYLVHRRLARYKKPELIKD